MTAFSTSVAKLTINGDFYHSFLWYIHIHRNIIKTQNILPWDYLHKHRHNKYNFMKGNKLEVVTKRSNCMCFGITFMVATVCENWVYSTICVPPLIVVESKPTNLLIYTTPLGPGLRNENILVKYLTRASSSDITDGKNQPTC